MFVVLVVGTHVTPTNNQNEATLATVCTYYCSRIL